ncbi:MAG: hypothetical protein HFH46_00435 [Bacilli bacterium]|nr:hypothetical protein [Bacilli bacterium]
MELAPLFWSWLATIVGSFTLTTILVLDFIKTLAKQGYKFNLDKNNSTPIEENNLNFQKTLFFIPIINLVMPFLIRNIIYKNSERLVSEGYIIPLNQKEQKLLDYEPTLSNILDINMNKEEQIIGIMTYIDKNNQINEIEFIDEDGIVTIEETIGPDIEAKNSLEQRATLFQLLLQEELDNIYEMLQDIIEEAIKNEAEEINLVDIEPYEIGVIASLIANYGSDIQINIRLIDGISPEAEKEALIALRQSLKEISGFDISFPEEEPHQKTLKK